MDDIVVITPAPISLDGAVRALGHQLSGSDDPGSDPEAGALVTFSGMVRATEGERTIGHLDYEHYEGMAERECAKLIAAARQRWPVRRAGIWHRTGPVRVGEPSVIVAVSAGHRTEAFEAARFLIDELKRSVPVWKLAP